MKLRTVVAILGCVIFSFHASALEMTKEQVTEKFKELSGWTAEVESTEQSPVDGFYQIIADGRIFYVSKDGDHMFSGNLFDFEDRFVNRTEPRLRKSRFEYVTELEAGFVEYKAENEAHVVYVFTDPSCGFCRKLHNNISGYNQLGITVKYIPFPRSGKTFPNGMPNPVYQEVQNAMCGADLKASIDDLFSKKPVVEHKNCSDNDLIKYVKVGKKAGVSATPAIMTQSGAMIRGFLEPNELLRRIGG